MLRSNAAGTPVWFSIHDTNRSDKTFYIEISRYTSNHESTGRFSHTRSHDARGHSGETRVPLPHFRTSAKAYHPNQSINHDRRSHEVTRVKRA